MRRITRAFAVAAIALLLSGGSIACHTSPDAPTVIDLTGAWAGTLPLRIPDEDWSRSQISLVQAGTTLTGELSAPNATRYPLSGTVSSDGANLTVGGLPGTSTCASILLVVSGFEVRGGRVQSMFGRAMGSCYGTVDGAFEMRRIG